MSDTNQYRIVDNPDNSRLFETFPQAAKGQMVAMVGRNCPEPMDFIPHAGQSTFRGSKPIVMPSTPAGVVYDYVYKHGTMNPGVKEAPPEQFMTFHDRPADMRPLMPDEEEAMKRGQVPANKCQLPIDKNPYIQMKDIEPVEGGKDMLSCKPPIQANPCKLPPLTPPEMPWTPTEDDIVKVLGYNETNIKLLAAVSERIGKCSAILAKINDNSAELDVHEILSMLSFIDNEAFRTMLSNEFKEILNKNLALSAKITSYLQGTADIEEESPEESGEEGNLPGGNASNEDASNNPNPAPGENGEAV